MTMTKTSIPVLVLGLLFLTTACGGPRNVVVLVPDPDGSTGSISVSNEAGQVLINSPYQSTQIKDG